MKTRFVRSRVTVSIAGILLALTLAASAEAGTVRGILFRENGGYPAQGVPVTVRHPNRGRSGASYSGRDGMYYLYNIPPGEYTLEVWVYPNRDPWIFQIVVYDQPYTDIGPIYIP